jgi:hypothetical protein
VLTAPPLATPPFPEHPSGHNCAAGADKIAFSAKSGTARTFGRLSGALQENIDARVWAGIHFRTADVQGALLGETVARYVHRHDFHATE